MAQYSAFIRNLTIFEAVELGLYDDREEWAVWGTPMLHLPTGWWPTKFGRLRSPRRFHQWSFADWERNGLLYGIQIKILQDPLYYYIKNAEIDKRIDNNRHKCSMRGCGKAVYRCGCLVKNFALRRDLCGDHLFNFEKRGLLIDAPLNAPAA